VPLLPVAFELEAVMVPRCARVGSLGTRGYGSAFEHNVPAMMPLEQWSFDSPGAAP